MTSRYQRQIQVDQIGQQGQQALSNAHVLVVGVGGLGCHIATLLAGAGVGKVVLLDHDRVSLSNLHRQTLYCENDIDQLKADLAASKLHALNSTIVIDAVTERLSPNNVNQLCRDASLVIDAADNFAASYLLSDACDALSKPLLSASVNRTYGYVGLFCDGAPSLTAVFPKLPNDQLTCETAGVTGPSVAIVAGVQAQEALKVLLGRPSLRGKLLYFDLWNFSTHTLDVSQVTDNQVPQMRLICAHDILPNDFIIDVRNQHEVADSPQNFQVHLRQPLDKLMTDTTDLPDTRLVLACQTGQRAMLGAQTLIARGHNEVAVILPVN